MYPCTIVCIYAYACRHAFDQGGRAALSRRPRIHPVGEHFFKEISQRAVNRWFTWLRAPPFIEKSKKDSKHAYISFSVFRLDKFWRIGCLQPRALESNSWKFDFRYQRHSADAVITCLFMPCVSRFIITSQKFTCTFSLCENDEHQRFFSTFTGTKHSQLYIYLSISSFPNTDNPQC